jgi:hypothetical protein
MSEKDMSNWKGRIGEFVGSHYLDDFVIPKLKEEGWDEAFTERAGTLFDDVPPPPIFPENQFFIDVVKYFLRGESQKPPLWVTNHFISRLRRLTGELLINVPDLFLVKLKKTGEQKTKKEILDILMHDSRFRISPQNIQTIEIPSLIQVYDGEIEVVEVKLGKAHLQTHQKESYQRAVSEGFPLRLILVEMLSFDRNQFEVKASIITNASDKLLQYNKKRPLKGGMQKRLKKFPFAQTARAREELGS